MKGVCAKGWQGNLQGTLMMMVLLFAARPLSCVELYRKRSAGEVARLQLQDEGVPNNGGLCAYKQRHLQPSVCEVGDGMRSRQW